MAISLYAKAPTIAEGKSSAVRTIDAPSAEPPEAGIIITADFEFDVPVRFDTDELQISMDSYNSGSWNSIPLIELRI